MKRFDKDFRTAVNNLNSSQIEEAFQLLPERTLSDVNSERDYRQYYNELFWRGFFLSASRYLREEPVSSSVAASVGNRLGRFFSIYRLFAGSDEFPEIDLENGVICFSLSCEQVGSFPLSYESSYFSPNLSKSRGKYVVPLDVLISELFEIFSSLTYCGSAYGKKD